MSRRGVLVAVACGIVVMAALVVAAVARPVALLSRPDVSIPLPPVPSIATSSRPTPTSTSTATQSEIAPSDPSPFLIALVQIVLVLTAVIVMAVLIRILVALWRRPRITLHEDPSFEIPDVPVELLRSADQRVELLRTGAPRNAIVAAWLDLETAVAATGLPRDPAETSTEFTERVIGTWDIDRLRLGDLAALYREARFSVHELDESHRERALRDLETLHADLARVVTVGGAR
ncbi:DUF4129 domain-containing protein [Humibacillus xanthopallidus]|uniref:DUF4129 domain-containing protein n=1 Tax=Humibacillus xanthopallidus TaxID=412689 RepID=UPI00384C191E